MKTINLENTLILYLLRIIDLLQNKDNVYDSYKFINKNYSIQLIFII